MKKFVIGMVLVLMGLIAYEFLFGKFFAYSPLFLGFSKHESTNSIVYVQNKTEFHDYEIIDSLIPAIEGFHELNFIRKPEIFIFRDRLTYMKHSPSKARFCAFYNGHLFVSPWALKEAHEGKISLKIYLRHELSHVLLHQHSGILHAYQYPKWLLEGIAVYSSNQLGTSVYPSKEETYAAIAHGNFLPPFDFKTKKESETVLQVTYPIAFMYSEFACIVDYLIAQYGKAKFLTYMKSLIKNSKHDKIFKQIYGIDFGLFLEDFKHHVLQNNTGDNMALISIESNLFHSTFILRT